MTIDLQQTRNAHRTLAPSGASDDVDWIIVGGGIHGVHIAVCLLTEGGVAPERVMIVDPAPRLLAQWNTSTRMTGMRHLRSPSVHHLDHNPFSLRRFAARRENRHLGGYAAPYDRPALAMFNAHCERVIATHDLEALHVRDRVTACRATGDGVVLTLACGRGVHAQSAVLALGSSEEAEWPTWAPRDDPRVQHVFASQRDAQQDDGESIGIVGGGVSAAQIALRHAGEGRRVTLFTRHEIREQAFDSDPGWLGPRNMGRFEATRDLTRRREMINAARHRGSMPRDVQLMLRRALDQGEVTLQRGEIRDVTEHGASLRVDVARRQTVDVDRLLLATGFTAKRPGGALIDNLVASESLRCAPCGFPIVDGALRWHPRIHVTGPLAELELGPVSRNIAGARRAGERVVASLARAEPSRIAV